MQPIRKNELEFHEKLIEKKASSQKNELDRKIRVEAEKLTEKSLVWSVELFFSLANCKFCCLSNQFQNRAQVG